MVKEYSTPNQRQSSDYENDEWNDQLTGERITQVMDKGSQSIQTVQS
jgi:hypothetical protein